MVRVVSRGVQDGDADEAGGVDCVESQVRDTSAFFLIVRYEVRRLSLSLPGSQAHRVSISPNHIISCVDCSSYPTREGKEGGGR